jgi:hypothetical protein
LTTLTVSDEGTVPAAWEEGAAGAGATGVVGAGVTEGARGCEHPARRTAPAASRRTRNMVRLFIGTNSCEREEPPEARYLYLPPVFRK